MVANSDLPPTAPSDECLHSASSDFSINQSIFPTNVDCAPDLGTLIDLRTLQDGWDGEGSLAIGSDALASAVMLLVSVPKLRDLIRVYPTFDGGVLLEYMTTDWSYSLEVAPTGTVGFCGVQIAGLDEFDLVDSSVSDEELLTKIRETIS